jgi:hypothetical protein
MRIFTPILILLAASFLHAQKKVQKAPAPVAPPAPVVQEVAAPAEPRSEARIERVPVVSDTDLQRRLDSLSRAAEAMAAPLLTSDEQRDSLSKAAAQSAKQALQEGKYVARVGYDLSNFDHWKIDTIYQKKMKDIIVGEWRTALVPHGHAFRDASLRFAMNDTLYGITRTYSDSGRYQMTGEYKFQARYRFSDDSTIISREVFVDRNVVRWDHIRFQIDGNRLLYHLEKLEFRDLNDNWLNALQGFGHVSPEIYVRKPASASPSAPK